MRERQRRVVQEVNLVTERYGLLLYRQPFAGRAVFPLREQWQRLGEPPQTPAQHAYQIKQEQLSHRQRTGRGEQSLAGRALDLGQTRAHIRDEQDEARLGGDEFSQREALHLEASPARL